MSSSNKIRLPAEWEKHRACWVAWPSNAELWGENLASAQQEVRDLFYAIARSEHLEILAPAQGKSPVVSAAKEMADLPATWHNIAYGDIWLRDTAPIFCKTSLAEDSEQLQANCFQFNGWGGKFILPHDNEVASKIAHSSGAPLCIHLPWVLEGGSIESNGNGTCITTRQCLLNPNRFPHSGPVSEQEMELRLHQAFAIKKVIWLDEGLQNDHTDGHIDNLARFVNPTTVVCQLPADPNQQVLRKIHQQLLAAKDANNQPLQVITIPSPGIVRGLDNEPMPASYMNFYISNDTVIVPTYGTPFDQQAVQQIGACFPQRQTVGLPAKAILSGGGSFHCITQQEPA